jgi:two-component system response regulator FixJ
MRRLKRTKLIPISGESYLSTPTDEKQTVFIVDDDPAIRHAMSLLLRSVGLKPESFATADDFLERFDSYSAECLVLDIRMPGLSGLELQQRLLELGVSIPIIFITGHADVPMAVAAMQKGAFAFIQKPFRDQELLESISEAMISGSRKRRKQETRSAVEARLQTLTRREREVMDLVVAGKPNKVIAFELGVSQRTVEVHRARVMEKMQARSLADLVRMNLL